MFEDINHSGDGGLYGELLVNRAFQGSAVTIGSLDGLPQNTISSSENPAEPFGPVLTGYRPIGDVRVSLDRLHPLSDALPTVMQIDILENATGEVGFLNEGWWGINVEAGVAYNSSFFVLANSPAESMNLTGFNVSLRSNLTSDVWTSARIPVQNLSAFDYTQLSAPLMPLLSAPNSNNTFAVTMDASEVAGTTFYFDLISLFGATYKNRTNGLRADLAQHIKDLNPAFLRFPGGNNLEGYSVAERWKWNETIGALTERPGRPGTWEYYNTDGLGLLEYLEWTEDMEIERVLAVYAGYSLAINGAEGVSYPEEDMGEVLQSALDELEYCMGDLNTTYGALRATHGHPDPFPIHYVEIGNEDFFSSTYNYRFPYMYNGLKAKYPNITYISTAYNENEDYNISIPAGNTWDLHHYEEPTFFLENFNFFDNWQESTGNENVTIFIGEYSVIQRDTPSGVVNFTDTYPAHIAYPQLLSAVAESVYLIGAERNPNVVKMSSYAPSFQNFNWFNWTPDLVGFTANPNETVLTVSWYAQSLLAHYRGTQTLPTEDVEGGINPLYWVATIDEPTNVAYFKVVNAGNATVSLTLDFDTSYTSVNGTILTNPDVNGFNYRNNATAIVPVAVDLPSSTNQTGTTFEWGVPAFSITVLQFQL